MRLFRIHPEIISVHIPKTAGSTFRAILQNNYGFRLKYVYQHEDLHTWNTGREYRCKNPFVKAVHGHIEAHPSWKNLYPGAKIVGWVRDPVERVISAYYHWKKEIDHGDARHNRFVELKPDLVAFTEMEEFVPTVNALQTYLGRVNPESLYFIGRTEHFEKDLKVLAKRLAWKNLDYVQRNINPAKPEIEPAVKEKLRQNLKGEYTLYKELLQQREHF